jgi:oxygen-dependent protoporphyrinogen oxidase
VGGAGQRDLAGLEDAAMIQVVREELRSLLGLTAEPLTASVSRFPEAMPQYHVGHLARIAAIEEAARRCPGLFLTGNGFRGLGLPDCIHHARATAERMLA